MLASTASFASDVCKDKTKEAKKLYTKCKKEEKGTDEYKQCASSYKSLKVQVQKACAGGAKGKEALKKNINQWNDLVKKCRGKKNTRCAEAQWRLGHYTFSLEELLSIEKQDEYDKDVQWCDDRDNQPAKCKTLEEPKAHHEKSLSYFEDYIKKYPKQNKTPNVMYQASFIYEMSNRHKEAFDMRMDMVKTFPNHAYTPKAWLRIGEYHFLERSFKDAIVAYNKVTGFESLTGKEAALALYHKAESFYNLGDYDNSAETFYNYINGSDLGKYPPDMRSEAMDFMSASFADMEGGGIEELAKFLKDKKNPVYKDSVYYRVGMKNKDHDRNDEAIAAFKYLLDISPNYVDAPLADIALVDILVTRQKLDAAQARRLIVVDRYAGNSEWRRANASNTKSIEAADAALRRCMLAVPKYHHAQAGKLKKEGDIDAAKEQYSKALATYKKFLTQYPDPSWDEYNVHIRIASVHSDLEQYKDAAKEYNWVADADTVKYGRKPKDHKDLMSKPDAAYNAVIAMDNSRRVAMKARAGDDAVKAYAFPETNDYFQQVARYMSSYSNREEVAEIAYTAAVIHYNAKKYEKAISELDKVRKKFPKHKYIMFIVRMQADARTQSGKLDEAMKDYEWLLTAYKAPTCATMKTDKPVNCDSMAIEIDNSIAAVMFQKAEKSVKSGNHAGGAEAYLAMVKRYPTAKFADRAVFEAASSYESGKDYMKAAETFMLMPRKYVKSPLTIKAIVRAAQAYEKGQKPMQAANTYLFITNNFPEAKGGMAFQAIGSAAKVYKNLKPDPDYLKAAETYEIAYKKFPKHKETPSYLYSAGLMYDSAGTVDEAIRCNKLVVANYSKSDYAIDAAFSIPKAYENNKKWPEAAAAYKNYAKQFTSDKPKLIAAYHGAAQAYMELQDEANAKIEYTNLLKAFDKWGLQIKNADTDPAAEGAYRLGEFKIKKLEAIQLVGSAKERGKNMKAMTDILQSAMSDLAKSASYKSKNWTFKATNKMASLFVIMAAKIREQPLIAKKKEEQFVERIGIVQQLPSFYEQARPLFGKNLELARSAGFYNDDVVAAEEGYIEMFYQDCATFFEVADAFRNAPLPDKDAMIQEYIEYEGLAKADAIDEVNAFLEEYKAELDGKADLAQQGGVPRCVNGIKASAHYGIDNKWTTKLQEAVKLADETNVALAIKIEKFDPATMFNDNIVFKLTGQLENIKKSSDMTPSEKLRTYEDIIKDAKKRNSKLMKTVKALRAKLAPVPVPGAPGTAQ